ncbi:MAG: hypothetical protein PHI53_00350 [Candidatus Pacebacteria bacterium]|nr:hypothetical protein [Candidatus Paceibacterota bacterium]
MERVIFYNYLVWHFIDIPKKIIKGWSNFLYFNFNYFSIPVLIMTLFSHYRRYYYPYGDKLDPWRYVEAFVFNNILSRFIGMLFRSIFIILGLIIETLIFIIGLLFLLTWLLSPVLSISLFLFGINTAF